MNADRSFFTAKAELEAAARAYQATILYGSSADMVRALVRLTAAGEDFAAEAKARLARIAASYRRAA